MVAVLLAALLLASCSDILPRNSSMKAVQPLKQAAINRLAEIGSTPGAPMMIRIFKQSSEFEVWKQSKAGPYKLYKTYAICAWSGTLGPKIKEGDRQAPEGFYNITPAQLNPNSNYYLSFNTGFPNKFDRAWGRTGANLMVHGDCSSAGCYSMTDESVAEIYALARETFNAGNTVIQMQIFPFRMTPQNLALVADNPNLPFWMDIKEGYDRFELAKTPPSWDVCEKKYVFDLKGPNGAALDAAAACPARGSDTLLAALSAKEAADDAQFKTLVAQIADRNAKSAADKQAAEAEKEAAKARGEAIGGFISGVFGGGNARTAQPAASGSTTVAPTPMPRRFG
ncbi:MAG: murein L,D-transpeptidase [Devosia sp.]|uniref:L,D-transpeptidase family protein n=1 Tax=unclassified Devosia TaxID=196773 RepID=UPI001AC6C124|nr:MULTISPECIES: murein L,D-transpeptidase family protein [unclassified Devosia]MBN9307328.1 murein L,D-transpeptidase [Devosia sp.]